MVPCWISILGNAQSEAAAMNHSLWLWNFCITYMHWRILGSGIVWFCDTTVDFFLFNVFAKYTEKLAEVGTSIKKGWGKDMGLEFCQDIGL